jgi:hypothetical protein
MDGEVVATLERQIELLLKENSEKDAFINQMKKEREALDEIQLQQEKQISDLTISLKTMSDEFVACDQERSSIKAANSKLFESLQHERSKQHETPEGSAKAKKKKDKNMTAIEISSQSSSTGDKKTAELEILSLRLEKEALVSKLETLRDEIAQLKSNKSHSKEQEKLLLEEVCLSTIF